MLFACEVGCKIAEAGVSGRSHVSVGTPDRTDIMEKGGQKGEIISTKCTFLFDIVVLASPLDDDKL